MLKPGLKLTHVITAILIALVFSFSANSLWAMPINSKDSLSIQTVSNDNNNEAPAVTDLYLFNNSTSDNLPFDAKLESPILNDRGSVTIHNTDSNSKINHDHDGAAGNDNKDLSNENHQGKHESSYKANEKLKVGDIPFP